MSQEHIHFVTGRLAAPSLDELLKNLAPEVGFSYSVDVLPISVAALMPMKWLTARAKPPTETARVLVPGECRGDLRQASSALGFTVERGPRDLRELPEFFGRASKRDAAYGQWDIEILAEINHAPRLSREEMLAQARGYRASGADVIDVGCDPGETWSDVADAVAALRDAGCRVSIDSMNPREIAPAVKAGAELVLSVNSTNREAAPDWGCEVVVVPDATTGANPDEPLANIAETVEWLERHSVPYRLDPILEPIGFGWARSLDRYLECRRRFPDCEMMMGIGNLTELTDADSAGINLLLLGFCQEIGIRSVLTTEVIHWAGSSVRECDLARRLVHYAVNRRMLPKHLEPDLHLLRDAKLLRHPDGTFERMADEIKDPNYRIFAQDDELHVVTAGRYFHGRDVYKLFTELVGARTKPLSADHAFYLGYELAKATTALTLWKEYRQDQPLRWGFLTRQEDGSESIQRQYGDPTGDPRDDDGKHES